MKIVIILITVLLLMGCKTKNTLKNTEIKKSFEKIEVKKDSIKSESKIREKEAKKEILYSEQKKENQVETEIKGKAETHQPLEFFNVENGDTLQSIKVTGNAEVHIKTKSSNSIDVKKVTKNQTITEKLQEFTESIVRENNVQERAEEFKQKSKEAVTRTGTFWSFGLIGGLGSFALLLIAVLVYFKKYRK
ncbi:hypothetical protein PFY12_14565 [Chryseobacterium camelliae]|uniref:Lipoprotein n=1 Tax=Chryseobacterium camelliae TaxID=1265445 RepID=A0ABY7QNF6_9FLAO|nr:hypothetical protein [Chryseobacterium camelliae]WBV60248.1 hypothetical protein PFY12_14565 [Chryseobacterium camelliae]